MALPLSPSSPANLRLVDNKDGLSESGEKGLGSLRAKTSAFFRASSRRKLSSDETIPGASLPEPSSSNSRHSTSATAGESFYWTDETTASSSSLSAAQGATSPIHEPRRASSISTFQRLRGRSILALQIDESNRPDTQLPELQWSPASSRAMSISVDSTRREAREPRMMDVGEAMTHYSGVTTPGPAPLQSTAQTPSGIYNHIQETVAKRISTFDYLRKTHEGRVYWYNTLLFSKADILRLPSFDPRKLGRRASNYILLGLSLPLVMDLNTSGPLDYLRALNAVLLEYETYQSIHPADGSGSSSLSRARLPQMFKRSNNAKNRRQSSAAEIGLPMSQSDHSELKSMVGSLSSAAGSAVSFTSSEQELLPGEEYSHLLTPALPFDPDFFEVFATLCEILIDCYDRIITLVSSPSVCNMAVHDFFSKVDIRLKKLMLAGIVKEFEDASRIGVKTEVAGISKVVLGGLM